MEVKIGESNVGRRLDTYLNEYLNKELGIFLTRNIVQNFIEKGCLINGNVCKKSYKLKEGDILMINTKYWNELREELDLSEEILPQEGKLDIRYEDDDMLVLYKEKGLVVHPGVGNGSNTLANFVRYYLEPKGEYDSLMDRGGIVHRLDKGVSGLIVVAKNKESQEYLRGLFKNHEVIKIYRAKVEKVGESRMSEFKNFEQDIDFEKYLEKLKISFEPWKSWFNMRGYIGRSSKNRYKMEFREYEFGGSKYAQSYILKSGNDVLVKIETGRMHQIRVSLEYLGLHILGDTLYGVSKGDSTSESIELESVMLSFKSKDGEILTFRV